MLYRVRMPWCQGEEPFEAKSDEEALYIAKEKFKNITLSHIQYKSGYWWLWCLIK